MLVRGGIDRAAAVTVPFAHPDTVHLMTLCRFDDKSGPDGKTGPFIPCERRLGKTVYLEIQGRDFWRPFLNREYGRPHD